MIGITLKSSNFSLIFGVKYDPIAPVTNIKAINMLRGTAVYP
jgi:hypothetical protein